MRKLLLAISAFLFFGGQLLAQKTISGRVTDEKGSPLANVSVVVKGTNTGTVTKADGTYTLTIPANARQLEFSFVGLPTQTVTIAGATSVYSITMVPESKALEEVVITGLSRAKKSEFAGASTKIVAKDLENRPVGSFDQMLQGRAAGVLALNGSGQPGNASTIVIRGVNSVSGGSQPLYIVDGVPVEAGAFQALNPNDFATIDIFRDAATQALYGSRGSAGVIVITTKRGVAGKIKVGYSGQVGIKSTPDFAFRPMNTSELLQAQYDYGKITGSNSNSSIPGWYYSKDNPRYAALSATDKAIADARLDSISKINVDWYDLFFRKGSFSNHEVSVSGGTGKTRIYTSLGIYNEEGIINPSDMQRITLRNNVDFADDRFTFALSSNFGYVKRNFDPAFPGYIFNSFLTPHIMSPYSRAFRDDGGLLLNGTVGNATYFGAQFLDIKKLDKVYNDQLKATLGITMSYKIMNNLTAAVTAGADFRETQNTTYNSRAAYVRTPASGQGSLTQLAGAQAEALTRFLTSSVRPSITYQKLFGGRHDVEITALGEYVQENSKAFNLTGYGIDPRTPNTPGVIQQGNAGNQLYAVVGGDRGKTTIASGLALVRYTFNGKYTFTGSYRKDGSSKLPVKNRWADFYAVGAIWDLKKESFVADLRGINVMRLRASYGGSGNHNNFPGDYLYLATYGTGAYSGLTTQVATYVGNPDAKWETTKTLNVGLDFELLNRRLYGDVNWYDKRTTDLFINKTLPFETSGGAVLPVNAGELQNTGFEWNINGDVIRNRNFVWTLFATGGYNKNKLISLGGVEPYESGTSFLKEGLPLGSHYEVKWGGVDAATGQPLYYDLEGKLTNVYVASNAVTEFGTWEAPWKGGFGTTLRYKAFDLSVLFSWQQGANKVDNLEYFVENTTGFLAGGYNQSSSLNFWKQPGDIASSPSPLYGVNFSSKIIHDASFVRLRDVVLSYTLPNSITSRTRVISNAKIYVQGSNLFMWTRWRGMDPEAGAVNLNLSEFPNPRAFTAGVNITF